MRFVPSYGGSLREVQIVVVSLGNTFVVLLVLEVRALLWGFSSHWEHIHRVVCHPSRSRGLYPPVGVLFEFQEVQVIIVLSGTRSLCRSSSHSFRFVIWPSLSVSNE